MASRLLLSLLFVLAAAYPVRAGDLPQPATIVSIYTGGYKDDFPQELSRVQSFILAAQSDIATELGLQYGQGFLHPVTIRFDDGAPAVNENPFFYVQSKGTGDGFSQEMVANVEAFAKRRNAASYKENNLRNGFRYALTQLMLNDLAAGDADKALPLWVQEGLSLYTSGDGEEQVEEVAQHAHSSHARELLLDLNSPGPYLTPRAWANYFLAVKYIADNGALQAFVREIVNGKSAADSVLSALGQDWSTFVANVRDYSATSFAAHAASDDDAHR